MAVGLDEAGVMEIYFIRCVGWDSGVTILRRLEILVFEIRGQQ